MKSTNRKILFSLAGIAVATPFLVIAVIIGLRASALADSLQGDLLVVVLGLASVVASLGESRMGLARNSVPVLCERDDAVREQDVRGLSTLPHGY